MRQEIPSLFSWNTQIVCNLWKAAAKTVMESCNGSWCSTGLHYLCKVKRRFFGDISYGWHQWRGKAGIMEMECKRQWIPGGLEAIAMNMDSKMTVEPFSPYKYEEESLASSVLYSGNGPTVIIHIVCASAWCSKDSHPLWWLVEDKAVTQAGNVSWRVQFK